MGLPTISLSSDFLASCSVGEWIWADVEPLQITKNFGFSQGVVRDAKGRALMRANGNFKLPEDIDASAGISVEDLLKIKGLSTAG